MGQWTHVGLSQTTEARSSAPSPRNLIICSRYKRHDTTREDITEKIYCNDAFQFCIGVLLVVSLFVCLSLLLLALNEVNDGLFQPYIFREAQFLCSRCVVLGGPAQYNLLDTLVPLLLDF
jgi:hypothetical protein